MVLGNKPLAASNFDKHIGKLRSKLNSVPSTRKMRNLLIFLAITVIVTIGYVFQNAKNQSEYLIYWKKAKAHNLLNSSAMENVYYIPNPEVAVMEATDNWITTCKRQETNRLGNQLFVFAALYGIARRNNITPVLNIHYGERPMTLPKLFAIPLETYLVHSNNKTIFKEKSFGIYDNRTETLPKKSDATSLCGYYQSWKYFKSYEKDIRTQLTLLPRVRTKAINYVQSLIPKKDNYVNYTYVGIHVRHGDITRKESLINIGYQAAPVSYFKKAIKFFTRKSKNVRFIVSSDDLKWTKKHIKGKDMYYTDIEDPLQDFAIQAVMNHTIMSVGTYGWWAAWIANGTTLYYKHPFQKNSTLFKRFKNADHFPPHWIPMDSL